MKYLCYDSALNEEYTLLVLMKRYPEHVSLFAGTDDAGIWDAAPWLFAVLDNFYELQGQPLIQLERCVIFETKDVVKDVCDFLHSKMYRMVNGRQQYYRIWDAVVLLKYLNECNDIDRQSFFQVFDAIYTEASLAELYQWRLQGNNRLVNVRVNKVDALPIVKDDVLNEEESDRETTLVKKEMVVKTQQNEVIKVPPAADEKPKTRRFFLD